VNISTEKEVKKNMRMCIFSYVQGWLSWLLRESW